MVACSLDVSGVSEMCFGLDPMWKYVERKTGFHSSEGVS